MASIPIINRLVYSVPGFGSVQLRGQVVGFDLDGELGIEELEALIGRCQYYVECLKADAMVREHYRQIVVEAERKRKVAA